LFKLPGGPKNAVASALALAVKEGGRRLDCYDTVLPQLYSSAGFKAVARVRFDEEYKPPGWDYDTFKAFNNGRPDVVGMVYDPDYEPNYRAGDGVVVSEYDDIARRQSAALRGAHDAVIAAFDARYRGFFGDAEFKEENVKRDDDGKFAAQEGGGKPKTQRAPSHKSAPLTGNKGHEATISSRNPTALGRNEAERRHMTEAKTRYNRADLAGMKQDHDAYEHNMRLLGDATAYPNLRRDETEGKTADEIARAAIDNAKANLRFLYDKAPADIREHGAKWYEGAHDIAAAKAAEHHIPLASAVGVYAALSPQKLWDMNVYLGDRTIDIYQTKQNEPWSDRMTKVIDDKAATAMRTSKAITEAKRRGEPPEAVAAKVKEVGEQVRRSFAAVAGKTLAQCPTPEEKALWIIAYDEAVRDGTFARLSPEGERLGTYRNKDGTPTGVTSQTVPMMANAIRALESNGDRAVISDAMGRMHKVRSFYNNILDPKSENGDVTMDTHAVGAALLRPLGGNDKAVQESMSLPGGHTANSSVTGSTGTYGLWADAYRELAADLHLEPRVLQSITWEAKRRLFDQDMASAIAKQVEQAWQDYHLGKQSLRATQDKVWSLAGGIEGKRMAGTPAKETTGGQTRRGRSRSADATAGDSGNQGSLYQRRMVGPTARVMDGGGRGPATGRIAGLVANVDRAIARFFGHDAEFKEEEHKRDDDGKFAAQEGGGGQTETLPRIPNIYKRGAVRWGFETVTMKEDGSLFAQHADGDSLLITRPGDKAADPVHWTLTTKQGQVSGTGLGDMYKALEDAGKTMGPLPPTEAQKAMQDNARAVAKRQGFNLDNLSFSDEVKTFELGGQEHYYAGAHYSSGPDKGKVVLYNKFIKPETVRGIAAHEVMHQKFQEVLDAYGAERERQTKDNRGGDKWIMKPDGELREEFRADYPVYAALEPVMYRGGQWDKLREADGVTDYSRSWWKAFEDGKADIQQAYHETLAEIAYGEEAKRSGQQPRLGEAPAAAVWKRVYRTVNQIYKGLHAKAARDAAVAAFDAGYPAWFGRAA
jgi:hypothetical protein